MGTIKFVCVSDLHLGAGYSLLTNIDGHGNPDHSKPSPTLDKFSSALTNLLASANPNGPPPKLVLLGDVLDFALSPQVDCAKTFKYFIEAFFREGHQLFDDEIIFVAGNHDHHVWEVEKSQLFIQQMASDGELTNPTESTRPSEPLDIESSIMTGLIRHYEHLHNVKVSCAYPNLALTTEDKSKLLVMHHGHFLESTYTLMTTLNEMLTEQQMKRTVDLLERQNANWIEFLWSSFGNAGVLHRDLFRLYEVLMDDAASHQMIRKLTTKIVSTLGENIPVSASGLGGIASGITVEGVVSAGLDLTLGRASESERRNFMSVLSPGTTSGMDDYLKGPVRTQLESHKIDIPDDFAFIFGHTHKPFEDQYVASGFPKPINVYNTGGWVLDAPFTSSLQGASVVMIDDELNAASVRLFNDSPNGDVGNAYAAEVGGNKTLETSLNAAIDHTKADWEAFAEVVAEGLQQRRTIAMNRFFDPDGMPPVTRPKTNMGVRR